MQLTINLDNLTNEKLLELKRVFFLLHPKNDAETRTDKQIIEAYLQQTLINECRAKLRQEKLDNIESTIESFE